MKQGHYVVVFFALLWVGYGVGFAASPPPSPLAYPAPLAAYLPTARPAGLPINIQAQPYNNGQRELNLWRIEATKFVRSPAVLSPQADALAYTEAVYLPGTRQVSGALYFNALAGGVDALALSAPLGSQAVLGGLDPNRLLQQRITWWRVGDERAQAFAFSTLTVVDWSANGQRLLVKRKHGVQYTGLRPTDVAVVERATGKITVYGEILRAVQAWVANQPGQAANTLKLRAWDLEPLGWLPQSTTEFYVRAWAFSQNAPPEFLGLWRFDTQARLPSLISSNKATVPIVAANGWWIDPAQTPAPSHDASQPDTDTRPSWGERTTTNLLRAVDKFLWWRTTGDTSPRDDE